MFDKNHMVNILTDKILSSIANRVIYLNLYFLNLTYNKIVVCNSYFD